MTKLVVGRLLKFVDRLPDFGWSSEDIALIRADVLGLGDNEEAILQAIESVEFTTDDSRGAALGIRLQAQGMLGRFADSLQLRDEVVTICEKLPDDRRIELEILWIRTLLSAKKATKNDISHFLQVVESLSMMINSRNELVLRSIEHLVHIIANADFRSAALSLLEILIRKPNTDAAEMVLYYVWRAMICLQQRDMEEVRSSLTQAEKYEANISSQEKEMIRGMRLMETARVLGGLAEIQSSEPAKAKIDWIASREAISDAIKSLKAAGSKVSDGYLQEAFSVQGRIALSVGDASEAARAYQAVREIETRITHNKRESCIDEYNEASALSLAGRIDEALRVIDGLLSKPSITVEVRNATERLKIFLESHASKIVKWLNGDSGRELEKESACIGVREATVRLVRPLIHWWNLWTEAAGHAHPTDPTTSAEAYIINQWLKQGHAAILDYWGRGGLARLASILRGQPHGSVMVDAITVTDIRHWAEVLCPLSDTVIFRWKGPLDHGMGYVPVCNEARIAMGFGGHGYDLTFIDKGLIPGWTPGAAWSNYLPSDVITFLLDEGRELFKKGRIVVVPAALVGCTQVATGWTDALFSESLCGGVVSVVKSDARKRKDENQTRVINLSEMRIPYMTGLNMTELAQVLDDCEPWLVKLRGRIFGSMNDDLRAENWAKIRALHHDIVDALGEISDRFGQTVSRYGRGDWTLACTEGSISAGSALERNDNEQDDQQTQLLRQIAGSSGDLAPWIPYWRMQGVGGRLDWTAATSNRSIPACDDFQSEFKTAPIAHSWLYPGTNGERWLAFRKKSG